ncbi:unnamed protein product, partial [Meganyctiphanes norvegica]
MFGSGSNKPVCQFFLKGTCKYGTGCWNLHPQGQIGRSSRHVIATNLSGQVQHLRSPRTVAERGLLKDVDIGASGDLRQGWDRCAKIFRWIDPVTTFAHANTYITALQYRWSKLRILRVHRHRPDTYFTYMIEQAQSQWTELQNKHKQLREALKMSTPEAKEALKAVYNTKSSDGAQPTQSNAFGGGSATTSTPSVFGGSSGASGTTSTPAFGAAKPQSPAVFGGAAAFGAATGSSSVFGQQAKSAFGAGTSNSLFGASNTNLLNKTPGTPSGTSNSIFGSGTSAAQTSTFGNTQSTSTPNPFGGQSQSGLFGNAAANKANVFGGNAQTPSVFGKPAQPTGTFGVNQSTSSLFGATPQSQPQSQSVFGGSGGTFSTPASNTVTSTTPSLFGGSGSSAFGSATAQSTTTSIFGGGNGAQQPSGSVFGGGVAAAAAAAAAPFSAFGGTGAANQGSSAIAGSVFGSTPAPTATASIFGAAAAGTPQAASVTATGSVFGGAATGIQAGSGATPGSVFGGGAALTTPQSTTSSVFGGGAANTGVFGSTTIGNSGIFGGAAATATNTSSVFGSSVAVTPQPQTTLVANPFGNAVSVIPISGDTNKGDGTDMWYTSLDKLSAEDLREFQAESFTRVPLMPPPRNLCCMAA